MSADKENTSRRTAAGKQSFLSAKYCEQFKLVLLLTFEYCKHVLRILKNKD